MKTRTIFLVFAVLSLLLATILVARAAPLGSTEPAKQAPTATGDWPTYGHDPSRTAYNPDETIITPGNVPNLVQRWQVNIGEGGGPAYSAPSVANGKVYVASSLPSGNNFFALDAATGALRWSTSVGHGADSCFGVGIGSTPAVSGNVIAVGGGDAAYYGLDASTGAQLWRHAVNAGPTGFPWTSPLIAQGRVFVGVASNCDDPSVRGEVRALDLSTGNMVANSYFVPEGQAGAGIWNSLALSPDNSTLVAATGEDFAGYDGPYNRAMVSLDPGNLHILQANKQGATNLDLDWGTTPIIFHDSQGRTLVGANHKNGYFYTYVLDDINAGPIWQKETNDAVGTTAAYDPNMGNGGTLFLPAKGGTIYAVDPATKNPRWVTANVGGSSGLSAANGMLFANVGGVVVVLDERDGHIIKTLRPSGPMGSNSAAVISNGFIYWVSGSNLNAWSLPSQPAPTPTPAGCSISFSDVHPGDYFYDAVGYLYCHGVISGYSDNTFRPNYNTTRGQLTKIVTLAEGWPVNTSGGPHFADVPFSNPFFEYIETAYNHGIITGYEDGTFRPGNNITRGQLTKVVSLAEGWQTDTTGGPHFSDVPPADPFYSYIETAFNQGIISGYADGTFHPGNSATRGQISKIVYGVVRAR